MQGSGLCPRDSTSILMLCKEDVAAGLGERCSDSRCMLLKEHVAAISGHVPVIVGGYCSVLRSMLQQLMEDVTAILRRSFRRLTEDAAAI